MRLSNTGYLMDATMTTNAYIRVNTTDMLAVTWEVWTPQQLQQMAEQQQE